MECARVQRSVWWSSLLECHQFIVGAVFGFVAFVAANFVQYLYVVHIYLCMYEYVAQMYTAWLRELYTSAMLLQISVAATLWKSVALTRPEMYPYIPAWEYTHKCTEKNIKYFAGTESNR